MNDQSGLDVADDTLYEGHISEVTREVRRPVDFSLALAGRATEAIDCCTRRIMYVMADEVVAHKAAGPSHENRERVVTCRRHDRTTAKGVGEWRV